MQMPTYNPLLNRWGLRLVTFSAAALAAASATFWALKWSATPQLQTSAPVIFSTPEPAAPQVLARLLGAGQTDAGVTPVDNAASNFKLTGVVANRAQNGYALISVDSKPAKPYRVGEQINDALVLRSVAPRSAALAANLNAPATLTLDLPKLTQP